jgi:hypothetical protein
MELDLELLAASFLGPVEATALTESVHSKKPSAGTTHRRSVKAFHLLMAIRRPLLPMAKES